MISEGVIKIDLELLLNELKTLNNKMDSMQQEIKELREGEQGLREGLQGLREGLQELRVEQQELKEGQYALRKDLINRMDQLKDHMIDIVHEAANGYKEIIERETSKKFKHLEIRTDLNTLEIANIKATLKS